MKHPEIHLYGWLFVAFISLGLQSCQKPNTELDIVDSVEEMATPAPAAEPPATELAVERPVQGVFSYGEAYVPAALKYQPFGSLDIAKLKAFQDEGYPLEVCFNFPEIDPVKGEIVGIKRSFPTTPGAKYKLVCEIADRYEPAELGQSVFQKIAVDGEAVFAHDISSPAFTGWYRVIKLVTAKNKDTEIAVYLEAGELRPLGWGAVSETRVRQMDLEPVAGNES